MYNIFYNLIFIIVSVYFGIKAIAYGIYEIKKENNQTGGIVVITFSVLVVIAVNVVILLR